MTLGGTFTFAGPRPVVWDLLQDPAVLAKALPKEKFVPRARDAEEDEKNIFEKVKDIFG